MDANKMRDISREQFEQRYPVPDGACWNTEEGRYVLFHLKLCTVAKYERFVESWVCWQASREAVMVELPDRDVEQCAYSLGFNSCLKQSRAAIEAQGLKVEVKP